MSTKNTLAKIAKMEALKCFHGFVMQTEPNIDLIICEFPNWSLEKADRNWCAAFVYYCCKKAGYDIPIRPNECRSCNLAGCGAWEEWALGDDRIGYVLGTNDFYTPEIGDVVLFDKVFNNSGHDHIGIVIENKPNSIVVAEGNINNISGIIERKKSSHIRAYIRIPDNFSYNENEHTV